MPPRKTAIVSDPPRHISVGSGMTAGLEIWFVAGKFVLYDRSTDSRFADDVATWNSTVSLNKAATEVFKNAAIKNTT
jgi:hypothetical protein